MDIKTIENRGVAWESRKPLLDGESVMDALRAAGLPLSMGDGEENESDASAIVCLMAVDADNNISGIIASPSGIAYRFEPQLLDREFWNFAIRNYYVVTGNIYDRKVIADLVNLPEPEEDEAGAKKKDWSPERFIEIKTVKGRCISRKKGEVLSGMDLDGLLKGMGYQKDDSPEVRQSALF